MVRIAIPAVWAACSPRGLRGDSCSVSSAWRSTCVSPRSESIRRTSTPIAAPATTSSTARMIAITAPASTQARVAHRCPGPSTRDAIRSGSLSRHATNGLADPPDAPGGPARWRRRRGRARGAGSAEARCWCERPARRHVGRQQLGRDSHPRGRPQADGVKRGIDLVPDKDQELLDIHSDPEKLAFYLAIQQGPGEGHDQYVDDMFSTTDGATWLSHGQASRTSCGSMSPGLSRAARTASSANNPWTVIAPTTWACPRTAAGCSSVTPPSAR